MLNKKNFFILLLYLFILYPTHVYSIADTDNLFSADSVEDAYKPKLVLFYSETCPHCHAERVWLESIRLNYPQLVIEEYEVNSNKELSEKYCREYNTTCASVPRTFVSGRVFIGFSDSDGDLVYHDGYRAYIGYRSQIEKAIVDCIRESCGLTPAELVLESSKNQVLVRNLLEKYPGSLSTVSLVNGTYIVAWWSPARMSSNLGFPDVAVYYNVSTLSLIKVEEPSQRIFGVNKPGQYENIVNIFFMSVIALYLLSYLLFRHKLNFEGRYWFAGFVALFIVAAYAYVTTLPPGIVERFARNFPFPAFVFIIALADGFNPCAFTVLAVLLSLLTHTRSRRKMFSVGSVFIVVSALMYFLFIMAINFFGSWVFSQYGETLFVVLGLLVFVAGLINLKDFFFFKKGISLMISDSHREKIFRQAGKIVKKVDRAEDRRAFLAALVGTAFLAVLVNIVELGCTAMFPMAYTSALISNYGKELGFYHVLYTLFYSFVYVIPLFAILANFLYTFKSERLSENQARALKLVGGIMMISLGLILIFNPRLLTLLR